MDNPADIRSRGATASQLKNSLLWCEGPQWLKENEGTWPRGMRLENMDGVNEETKNVTVLIKETETYPQIGNVIDINRFVSLRKLLRVTAMVKRFIENIEGGRAGRPLKRENLNVEEIKNAERLWILYAQFYL